MRQDDVAAATRAILSDPDLGTPQANVNNQPIGPMPDLAKIMTPMRRVLQILLCVYNRLRRYPQGTLDPVEYEIFKMRSRDE